MVFEDRFDAGRKLVECLKDYKGSNSVVLALPRGGVPVGFEIAKRLHLSLEVIVVRKIGSPQNKELGLGAIAEGGVQILDGANLDLMGQALPGLHSEIRNEKEELIRRVNLYRKGNSLGSLEEKTVILVDDGLATGVTAQAAIAAVKRLEPEKIIFALPVCSPEAAFLLRGSVDDLICLAQPLGFESVGRWYKDFSQVSDEEVINLLERAKNVFKKHKMPKFSRKPHIQVP